MVGEAIDNLDAASLTDAALQLAEGERMLQEKHPSGITAHQLLSKAAALAAEQRDQKTLARLAKAAEQTRSQELLAQIQVARKLGSQARAADPNLMVTVESTTVEAFDRMHGLVNAVKIAALVSDAELLKEIESELSEDVDIPPPQREAIRKLVESAHVSLPAKESTEGEALRKLLSPSRGWGIKNVVDDISSAGKKAREDIQREGKKARQDIQGKGKEGQSHASEELWGEAGRHGYPATARVMRERSSNGIPLPDAVKTAVRAHRFLDGVDLDRVRVHWGALPANEWQMNGKTVRLAGVEAEAQTYGYDIYIRHQAVEPLDFTRIETLVHELTHVKQFMEFHSSLENFGYHYFKNYKHANENYFTNSLEEEAYAIQKKYSKHVYSTYRKSLRPPARLSTRLGAHSRSDTESSEPAFEIPADLLDAAFDPFVDLQFVSQGLQEMNVEILVDAALQMAEGDRVLGRNHRSGITAHLILSKATTLATEQRDQQALSRIAKAAEKLNDKELQARVLTAGKLSGRSRAADSELQISVENTTPEAFSRFRDLVSAVKRAVLLGDSGALEEIERLVNADFEIPEQQKMAIRKLIASGRDSLPTKVSPGDRALCRLLEHGD
jgi:hypothetical protein